MKILSGIHKGLQIKTSGKFDYRPTQSKVRKSIFDSLGPLNHLAVLDIFSGSGILGFESSSRGASSVTFVENNPKIFNLLRQNVLSFPGQNFFLKKKDAIKYLKTSETFDLIIADPPYNYFNQNTKIDVDLFIELMLKKISLNGRFVLECSKELPIKFPLKTKIFGETKICMGENR